MTAYLEAERRRPAQTNLDRELAYARRLILDAHERLGAPRLGLAEVTMAIDELSRAAGLMRQAYSARERERELRR